MAVVPALAFRDWTVDSPDGTVIGCRTIGSGEPIIVVPGALSEASDYAGFAQELAQRFTVHTIERRGRGSSGPMGDDYSIVKECQDVAALQAGTGAARVFGHSDGGLIALEAARRNPAVARVAVYEPGVSVGGSISMAWVPLYRQKLAEGKLPDAFAAFARSGPERARRMPLCLMKLILRMLRTSEERRWIYTLLPANLREHAEVARLDGTYPNYREVTAAVLLMAGGRSGLPWVAEAVRCLSEAADAPRRRVPDAGPFRTRPRRAGGGRPRGGHALRRVTSSGPLPA